ncbi:DNA-directed RNA polymerase subunit alpha [Porphyromonadaceae bacterium COT-184 OH4590]|nr:DNA-directed RNA polymerase subunit alpha [Porphyromonadaceae bacterium COT-184 OH4590]MDO4726828.1 DNA-directed RNA polymerase subunit alpha [Porphyromonadaceae bacterium]
MAILAFQRPNQVYMIEATEFKGKFEFAPLEPGYGITIGNALRRVLLSSLEGYAITSLKISGVVHEFDTIPHVIDDVTNIILNLKEIRFKHIANAETSETVTIEVSGRDVLKAKDLEESLSNFKVLNPEHVICTMDKSAQFTMEVRVDKGRGYLPADENKNISKEIGLIGLDAIFTPIKNVMYTVEPERVEQKTDYDKLILEIVTDGSIHPKQALKEASKILIQHFMLFTDEKITLELEDINETNEIDEDFLKKRQLLKTQLTDLDLSVRALNCLKSADLETLADLARIPKPELLKFRNFGKKSLNELEQKLESLNLSFGMDISKYKIDKEL